MSRSLNITLVQLEYLVALDKHRHFIRAAESCFVTQPTLSMQIKKLEEELGVKLFDRSRQPIIPTDVGKILITQAKNVLNQSKLIDELLQDYKGIISGDLTLGIIPTVSPYLLPTLIGKIRKLYPDVVLHVKELLTEEIIHQLQSDQLDAGIISTPMGMDGLIERPMFYEKFLVYLNESHPAYGQNIIAPSELTQDKIWLLSEGNCFRNQAINLCSLKDNLNDGFNFDYESGSLETLVRIVELEGGATIIPEWASLLMPDTSRKHMRPLKDNNLVREVSMVYTRNFAKGRLLDALEEMVGMCVPQKLKANVGKSIVDIRIS